MASTQADFVKFVKYFTTRLIQTLVQARLGQTLSKPCTAIPDQSDWFNFKVDEIGEVAAYLKSTIVRFPPYSPLVVEFILYTADGQHLPLEAWIVSVRNDFDNDVNVRTGLYHQMSTLLKSSAVAARMTPLHRLYVKKQNEESFIILYRVYESQTCSHMGANSKEMRLGELPSPFGTLCLDLIYRTAIHVDQTDSMESPSPSLAVDVKKMNKKIKLPCRPSFSDCIPVGTGEHKECASPMSAGMCVFATSPEQSAHQAPRFRLGRSTSSEESAVFEQPVVEVDKETRRKLASLRNFSFPLSSLLESAYSTSNKQNSVQSLNVEFDSAITNGKKKDSEEKSTENEQESVVDEDTITSDDSFVKICEFGSTGRIGSDLGELIKQLRFAPENLRTCAQTYKSSADINQELSKLSAKQHDFDAFMDKINCLSKSE